MKKYIIWDFDGTIANTNDIIIESWQATFRHYLGHELPREEVEALLGEVLSDTISRKIPGEDVEEVTGFYREYQYANNANRVHVFDGVRDVIELMRARGFKIGIATSRTTKSFWKYMRSFGMEDLVDDIVAVEDVSNHKPHPEAITRMLEKFGAKPEETIMIGDTKYDIGCANNAGVDSVLVRWSHYVDEDAMEDEGFIPTYRVEEPMDLMELLLPDN